MFRLVLVFLVATISTQVNAQDPWDLERCVDYAMQNNLTILQSRLNIDRSDVDLKQNKFSLIPSLNAGGTYGFNFGQRIDPFTNEFARGQVSSGNLFLSSSVDLFNAFSKMNAIRASEQNYKASEFDLQNVKNDISLQLCLFYLQILLSKENVVIAEQQVEITQAQVDRMEKLVNAGSEPQGNLYDSEAQLAQEELNLTNAENSVNLAILNLTQLLQLDYEQSQGFDIVTPNLTDEGVELLNNSSQDIYIRAKELMPEVQAAEARRSAAEYNLSSAKGQLYPTLFMSGSLGSGYSGNNTEPVGDGTTGFVPIGQVQGTGETVVTLQEQTFFQEDDFQTKKLGDQLEDNFNQNLQIGINIPIFNGNSAKSNVNRAKINQLDADITYSQITNQLRFEIEQAYADAKAAMNSYISADKAVKALEESFKYAEVRYEQSVINTVEFNNIKTQYTNAQSNQVRAKYDFVFRTKILDFYLGNSITL